MTQYPSCPFSLIFSGLSPSSLISSCLSPSSLIFSLVLLSLMPINFILNRNEGGKGVLISNTYSFIDQIPILMNISILSHICFIKTGAMGFMIYDMGMMFSPDDGRDEMPPFSRMQKAEQDRIHV